MEAKYTKLDTKGRQKLTPGMFSPSRWKTLESCAWQYELKYHKKLYPDQPIIEPHSQLGSAMHYFAEHYNGSGDQRSIDLLLHRAKKNFVLEDSQIKELEFMVDNLVKHIWPMLQGKDPEDPFSIVKEVTEANVKGDVVIPGPGGTTRVMPLNMKIDRLIQTQEGRVIIVDFKKGQAQVASHMFQLLFYAIFYSQKHRITMNNIEIWLVFPNEKQNWVRKVSGEELVEHRSEFEEDLKNKVYQIEKDAPFTEDDAHASHMCNFCPYQATPFCPTSEVLHGGDLPERKDLTFSTTTYSYGKPVKQRKKPDDVLTEKAW